MKQEKNNLIRVLEQLDQSAKKIIETRGYTREVKKVKLLEELIREQVKNENSSTSISTLR